MQPSSEFQQVLLSPQLATTHHSSYLLRQNDSQNGDIESAIATIIRRLFAVLTSAIRQRQCSNYRGINLMDIASKTSFLPNSTRSSHTPKPSRFSKKERLCRLWRTLELRGAYLQHTMICFVVFAGSWNRLPAQIAETPIVSSFKNRLDDN